jgi:tetratricopeptide (TPR) repeat protein
MANISRLGFGDHFHQEWILYYALADKYQELGYYTEGLKAAQKCVEIRPNDIRSVYALATCYNLITRAARSVEQEAAELGKKLPCAKPAELRLSRAAVEQPGSTETAAVQAIRWLEKALTLHPDKQSKTQLQMELDCLYTRFPHLKV